MIKHTIAVLLLAILSIVASDGFAMNGSAYLKIPNGARETAMGETGVSHSHGGAAMWWNPALPAQGQTAIEFQTFRWLADGGGSFGGASIRTGWGGFGVYYFNLGMDDFEARDRPGPPQATFSLHQVVIAGGMAVNIWHGFSVGAAYKTLTEDIYGDRLNGFNVFDVGIHFVSSPTSSERSYSTSPPTRRGGTWSAGTVLTNIASSDATDDPLPLTIKSGLSYKRQFGEFGVMLSGEGSAVMRDDDDPAFHLGLEGDWIKQLYLRCGLMTGYDTHFWTAGIGVHYKSVHFDFSLTPYDEPLGTVWRFGIGLGL
ncbi:MAG: PorV/PorQ family protein [Candidatus Electryoneaceae bacterium]|nr:PorV/PorQ family protein [Candidatus Electryoneaceae bacterium]